MSRLAEKTVILMLPDQESLETLIREGINLETLPSASLRPVVQWSMEYYGSSNKAPSVGVLSERWGDLLSDNGIDIAEEPEEALEWALDALYGDYVRKVAAEFTREMITSVSGAEPEERVAVLGEFSTKLSSLTLSLQSRRTVSDMRESGDRILSAYDEAVATQGQIEGLRFGMPIVDAHTGGIRPGEMAVIAAPAKVGKSFILDLIAYNEWARGQSPALFTLENSIEMTEARIACMATNISSLDLQRGTLSDADYNRLREWVNDVLRPADNPLRIFNPTSVNRTPHGIVQAARAYDCDSIVLDQLTFVETTEKVKGQSRSYELKDIVHSLKDLIDHSRKPLPLLAAHQIKREGITRASSTGRLVMTDMADSSEVERGFDFIFGLYQTDDDRQAQEMQLQGLASRRVPSKSFALTWDLSAGIIIANREVVDE